MSLANVVCFARLHSCRSSVGGLFCHFLLPSSSSYNASISASFAIAILTRTQPRAHVSGCEGEGAWGGGLVRAVCSAWRSSLRVDAAAPEGGAAKRAVRGASHTGLGNRRVGFFAVHCSWSRLALAVQLLLHCCGASPRSPPPRTRARGVRESKRASSARIPRGGTGAGDGRERRWRTAGKGATPRRGVLAAGGGKGDGHCFLCTVFFCTVLKKHGS